MPQIIVENLVKTFRVSERAAGLWGAVRGVVHRNHRTVEMDAGNANVLATLNALLSQPIAAFPDGMIPRHEAFVFIAAGNTTGAGADMKFVGRNHLDGATLDRFVFVFWEIDEDFEVFVAGDDQKDWTLYVQKCRKAAASCGVTENIVFATPRASINGAKALRRGKLSRSQVEQALLWGRLSAEDADAAPEALPQRRSSPKGNCENLVSRIFTSWNQMVSWLRQLQGLRRAA